MHKVFSILDLAKIEETLGTTIETEDEDQALSLVKRYFQKRSNYQGFLFYRNNSPEAVFTAMANIPATEKAHIYKVCAELKEKTFLFQEPWDMERTQVPYTFNGEIDWLLNPAHDPEWMFMLNRMNYLNVLAQAYLLTKDHAYTKIYMALLRDWLDKNPQPAGLKSTSWRSIDAAIRLRNWVKSLEVFLLDEAFSEQLLGDLIVSIKIHLDYLMEGLQINRMQTNWTVLESNGAYLGAQFFNEIVGAQTYADKALNFVTRAAQAQITSEGMHWEQSYQYHNEVLLKLAEISLLGKRNYRQIPAALDQVITLMARNTAHFRKPDGTQDNYGDSDREHVDELLLLLEQIIGEKLLDEKTVAVPNRFVLTHFGRVNEPLSLQPRLFANSYAMDEAGIYLIKDPQKNLHLQFKCGFLGHGHGHDDLLHFSLFANFIIKLAT